MRYVIQSTDAISGRIGCFGYDPTQGNTVGEFRAITPIFPDLSEFYAWAHAHNIVLQH